MSTSVNGCYSPASANERRNRIRLSVAAYAYEILDNPVMSDSVYDLLAKQIDTSVDTGNAVMDEFFRGHYTPHSGVWVRKHPDQLGLLRIYMSVWRNPQRKVK